MDEKKYQLHTAPALFLRAEDVERVLSLHDGNTALLYLYLLRQGGAMDTKAAETELHMSAGELRDAEAALRRCGVLSGGTERPLPPPEELPEYRSEEILRRSREDRSFRSLVNEAQSKLGHVLSGADLKTLFGIYDRLGLPCDVIMLIINRCAENARRRYGEGRLPTMHAIEKEAYIWCNREIMTLEQAEEYLAELDRREERSERLRTLLQIRDRQPTATERRYMEEWLGLGFADEVLELAYDKTVTGTGKLAWKYMDTILRAWYAKGLHTLEEIEKGDGRAPSRRKNVAPAVSPGAWQGDDLDRAERLMKKKE